MRAAIYLLILFTFSTCLPGCQRTPPFTLSSPAGWNKEEIPFPIDFAPQIAYKGTEYIRFTPGWGDPGDQHWSYAFLWWIEGQPVITDSTLQQNLRSYFEGLVGRNITKRKIASEKIVPTVVSVKKLQDANDNIQRWSATVDMLDYMPEVPVRLNCNISLFRCTKENRTGIFFEISPRAADDPVWKQLHDLLTVNCK